MAEGGERRTSGHMDQLNGKMRSMRYCGGAAQLPMALTTNGQVIGLRGNCPYWLARQLEGLTADCLCGICMERQYLRFWAARLLEGFNRRLTQIAQILQASLRILTEAMLSCAALIAADLLREDLRRLARAAFALERQHLRFWAARLLMFFNRRLAQIAQIFYRLR